MLQKYTVTLHCRWHESTRMITLKNCPRCSEWSFNDNNIRNLFSFKFLWVKIDKVSMKTSWIFPIPSISVILLWQVCVFMLWILWKCNFRQTIDIPAKWKMHNYSISHPIRDQIFHPDLDWESLTNTLQCTIQMELFSLTEHCMQEFIAFFDSISAELTAMFGLLIEIFGR